MNLGPTDLAARCAAFIQTHADASDPAHDPEHIHRVVANARHLAGIEGARLEIVIPAAWLHDCVSVPKHSPQRSAASRLAAAEATRLLADWGCEPDWLPAIHHAIEAHSFSAGITPRTLEAQVLQDADRLDALGAVGLARSLMLGGFTRRPLYAADDPFCDRRPPDEHRFTIDHFFTKLLHLAGTMQTAGGRREAEVRTAYLQGFLHQLRREIAFADGAAAQRADASTGG